MHRHGQHQRFRGLLGRRHNDVHINLFQIAAYMEDVAAPMGLPQANKVLQMVQTIFEVGYAVRTKFRFKLNSQIGKSSAIVRAVGLGSEAARHQLAGADFNIRSMCGGQIM